MTGRHKLEHMTTLHRSQDMREALVRARTLPVKISRAELAARSGVSESTIEKIESGKSANPGVFTLAALAVALDLDVSDLLRQRTGPLRPRPLGRPGAARALKNAAESSEEGSATE